MKHVGKHLGKVNMKGTVGDQEGLPHVMTVSVHFPAFSIPAQSSTSCVMREGAEPNISFLL